MGRHVRNYNKEMKNLKMNQMEILELKIIIPEIENSLDKLNNKLR